MVRLEDEARRAIHERFLTDSGHEKKFEIYTLPPLELLWFEIERPMANSSIISLYSGINRCIGLYHKRINHLRYRNTDGQT